MLSKTPDFPVNSITNFPTNLSKGLIDMKAYMHAMLHKLITTHDVLFNAGKYMHYPQSSSQQCRKHKEKSFELFSGLFVRDVYNLKIA